MLKAENLTLNVDDEGGKKCLLNNISFQVEDGEMLVITGPNGGGKSTLAKTLIGIQTPDSGYHRARHQSQGKCGNRLCIPAATEI